jgi:ATP-dependent Clp protease protease subunit
VKCYDIQNKNETATIYVYEAIGEDWMGEGLTAKTFADDVSKIGNVKEINVRINSPGGNVWDARAMASTLRSHKAKKIVDIDGICASAATYLACVGDRVNIAADGVYMVHPPSGFSVGTANEMRKAADMLDVIQRGMVEIYTNRTRKTSLEIETWINAETWMDAQQAVANGFADATTEARRMTAKADLSKYHDKKLPFTIPDQFKSKIQIVDNAAKAESDALREQLARNRQKLVMFDLGRK